MPIYAYRCTTCGHAKDVLQRMSDPVLCVCPECGASTFVKQVTAAGFQLKGSGWYVTDFKGANKAPAPAADGAASEAKGEAKSDAKADSTKPAASTDAPAKSDAAAPAAAPAPAAATPSAPASAPPAAGAK